MALARRPLGTILSLLPHLLQHKQLSPESRPFSTRPKSSGSGYFPLNDPSPNWSNRPPKETILLDGCDYEHWLIVMEFQSDPKPSEEEMVASYVKTLASVVGRGLPGVLWVLPDLFLDVPNKDYGGDFFVDGKVIPRLQYRFGQRQQNNRRPRPRYDRRREKQCRLRGENQFKEESPVFKQTRWAGKVHFKVELESPNLDKENSIGVAHEHSG